MNLCLSVRSFTYLLSKYYPLIVERKRSIKQKNEDKIWNKPMPFNEKIKLCQVHSHLNACVIIILGIGDNE